MIRAGWGSSGYYSEDVLRRDGPKCFPAGTHMYLDHPTITEEEERPERSVKDLAAVIVETPRMSGIDLVSVCELKENWEPTINAIAEDIGVSIRAYGMEEQGDAAGRSGRIITQLLEGISVDFVTQAGAGGKVGKLIQESRRAAPIEESLDSEIREALNSAGQARWGGENVYVYLEDWDVDSHYAIFWVNPDDRESSYLKVSFARDSENDITFVGEPTEVERQTNYVQATEAERRLVEESRNALHWMESGIHLDFTERADRMFGQGYMTREERIILSEGIGLGLQAFTGHVEEKAPQLLERDPFDSPGEIDTSVSESNDRSGGSNEREDSMAEKSVAAELSELQESFRGFKNDTEARLKESEDRTKAAEARADRAEDALRLVEAGKIVGKVVEDIEGLHESAKDRIIESALSRGVPTDSEGKIDRSVVEERARAAVREEQDYLAGITGKGSGSGSGSSSVLGESRRDDAEDKDATALERYFEKRGLSESAAKRAAEGRVD